MDNNLCIIYATCELDLEIFREEISAYLNLKITSTSFFESDFFALSIIKNQDFDKVDQCSFPDGFLYFKFIIEVGFRGENLNVSYINFLSKLLNWLWVKGVSAVASCDYENQLLNNGGYKNESLPWPKITSYVP